MANNNEFNGFEGKYVLSFVVAAEEEATIRETGVIWFGICCGRRFTRSDSGYILGCCNNNQEDFFRSYGREELVVVTCVPKTQSVQVPNIRDEEGKPIFRDRPVAQYRDELLEFVPFGNIRVLDTKGQPLEVGMKAIQAFYRDNGLDEKIKAFYRAHPVEKKS